MHIQNIGVKGFVLIALCVQNSSYALLTRYSRSVLLETWASNEVVMMAELLKMVISLCLMSIDKDKETASQGKGFAKVVWLLINGKKVFVLVLMYAVGNWCALYALARVDASVYTVLSQLKLFTTASFSVCFLNTKLSSTRVRALLLLACGCILVTSPGFNKSNSDSIDGSKETNIMDTLSGIGACLVMVTLSGMANVFFEKILKRDEIKLTIWETNVQLAFYSWIVVLLSCLSNFIPVNESNGEVQPFRLFAGWSLITVLVVILSAMGGILVAATLKYADAIIKNLAVSGSILLTTFWGYFWLDGIIDLFVLIGCAVTILALFNYAFDTTPVTSNRTSANENKMIKESNKIQEEERLLKEDA